MSFKHKITALISLMLMLVILLSMFFIFSRSSEILKVEAEKYMEAQLDRANENVSLLLKRIVLETENLSLDQNVKDYFMKKRSGEFTDKYLENLMNKKNADGLLYMDLFLVNHDGIIVSAAMKDAVGIDVSSRPYFKSAHLKKITDTSDIILSRADETQIVITLTPTRNSDDEVIGYTGIAIFATYFSNFLEDFNVSSSSGYILIDSFDNIVSHPNKELISSKFNHFGKSSNSYDELETIFTAGETYRILQKELGFNKWKMISYLKYNEIYAKSLELSYTFMKFGVLIFIIALVFSFYLTDMVSKPIVTITESINRMLDDEENFKSDMTKQMTLPVLGELALSEIKETEPTELSNLRKSILGFKDALEKGSSDFDVEHSKLQNYIDELYREIESTHGRNLAFISTLSHDIRTPLTLIKGYAMGLESGEVVDLDMRHKFQSGIVKSVDDIEKLVYNVLDFVYEINSIDAQSYEHYNLDEVMEELEFEIKQISKNSNRHITFEKRLQNNEKSEYALDLINFKRVIVNLINNSIKYTSNEELIKLKISSTKLGVAFEVYDEGLGIKEDEVENIFAMYYRTDDSKDIKGYGLGLYISQEILKSHGSKLKCKSEYGKFTSMYFELNHV